MPRQRLIISLDSKDEVDAFGLWRERWQAKVKISEDDGCGCCVSIFDVDGPQEALDDLPSPIIAANERD